MFKLTITQFLAILIFLYSSIVMVGWIFNIDALTQVLPNEINMQFITAFSFFISSIALWFFDPAAKDKSEISQLVLPATTITTLLIMSTLLGAGLFGLQTGIEDLFVSGNSISSTALPGMPSLPTMICFILFDIACILTLFELPKLKQTLMYLGTSIIVIGLSASLGYLFNIPFLYYKITDSSIPMAINTAVTFVFLGFGLTLPPLKDQKYENKS